MFNDPVAMLFLYIAINFFIVDYWMSGCAFFRYLYLKFDVTSCVYPFTAIPLIELLLTNN